MRLLELMGLVNPCSFITNFGKVVCLGLLGSPFLSWGESFPASLDKVPSQVEDLLKNPDHLTDSVRLEKFFHLSWNTFLDLHPEWATQLGFPGRDEFWTVPSAKREKILSKHRLLQEKVLRSIRPSQLNAFDQLSYDLFTAQLEAEKENAGHPEQLLPIGPLDGPQQVVPQVFRMAPKKTEKNCQDLLQRLETVPSLLKATQQQLKEGLRKKITFPQWALSQVADQIEALTVLPLEKNPLWKPFEELPLVYQQKAQSLLIQQTIPAFQALWEYWTQSYLPHCRKSLAWSDLPQGKAWYAFLVRENTTTLLSPTEIHQKGLQEVKRLEKKIDELLRAAHFKGTRQAYFDQLQKNPDFFYQRPEDLLEGYRKLQAEIEKKLPLLFTLFPQNLYHIRPIPPALASSYSSALYEPGSAVEHRPGIFFVNTSRLHTRPRWEMKGLFLHEAVPGHHFQISLAQESKTLPDFRKYSNAYTAFIEGWGLYAETLGHELGLYYHDLPAHLGQLNLELWRSIRLVVDTGLHSQGWSREQAFSFFQTHSFKSAEEIHTELKRYLTLPAQALAYKIGELTFQHLKAVAKKKWGPAFSLQKFHQSMLEAGPLPLFMLEKRFPAYLPQLSVSMSLEN